MTEAFGDDIMGLNVGQVAENFVNFDYVLSEKSGV